MQENKQKDLVHKPVQIVVRSKESKRWNTAGTSAARWNSPPSSRRTSLQLQQIRGAAVYTLVLPHVPVPTHAAALFRPPQITIDLLESPDHCESQRMDLQLRGLQIGELPTHTYLKPFHRQFETSGYDRLGFVRFGLPSKACIFANSF